MTEFVRFAIVGVSNTAITWAIYFLLAGAYRIDPVLANLIAWTLSSAWSFYWNRRFTFRSADPQVRGQLVRFILVNISAIGVSTLIIAALKHSPLIVGQTVATAATLMWNYMMCRRIVFAKGTTA